MSKAKLLPIVINNLCFGCQENHCCKYITIAIDPPTSWEEMDTLYWQLLHPGVSVFVDGKRKQDWQILIKNLVCSKWDPKTELCTIYETRPAICREYPAGKIPDTCERNGPAEHDQWFKTPEALREWAVKKLGTKGSKGFCGLL